MEVPSGEKIENFPPKSDTYINAFSQVVQRISKEDGRRGQKHPLKVLELGITNRIFHVEHLINKSLNVRTIFFGINNSQSIIDKLEDLKPSKTQVKIQKRSIKEGLPKEWDNMDIIVDFNSIKENIPLEQIAKAALPSLRPRGFIIILSDIANYSLTEQIRFDKSTDEDANLNPVLFRYVKGEKSPINDNNPNHTKKKLVSELKKGGYTFAENPSKQDIIKTFEDMTNTLRVSSVTNLDLPIIKNIKILQQSGFINIDRFNTPDGLGFIGQKAGVIK